METRFEHAWQQFIRNFFAEDKYEVEFRFDFDSKAGIYIYPPKGCPPEEKFKLYAELHPYQFRSKEMLLIICNRLRLEIQKCICDRLPIEFISI